MTDENELKREGKLPQDPAANTVPMAPPVGEGTPTKGAEVPPPHALLERWHTLGELDMLEHAPPRRKWLLMRNGGDSKDVGVLPLGKVGMLVAQGGAGKTIALCQLALSVAASPDRHASETAADKRDRMRLAWLGFLRCDSPGRVLLALGEEDAEEVHRRMYNAAKAMGLTAEDRKRAAARIVVLPLAGVACAFVESDGRGNVRETAALEQLRAKLAEDAKADPFRLILLDPLSRWAGADTEKDNAAAPPSSPPKNFCACSRLVSPMVPSITGTPTWAASFRAAILSPNNCSAPGDGPTKMRPSCAARRASPAFSLRKP